MFFPDTSIRTGVTFEKGVYLSGGQAVLRKKKLCKMFLDI